MLRSSTCFLGLLGCLTIAIPAAAQERRSGSAPQVADDEVPEAPGETTVVFGLQDYHPELPGALGEEVASLRRTARVRRIVAISLAAPGVLLVGSAFALGGAKGDSQCDGLDECVAGGTANAIEMAGALVLAASGLSLTLSGLILWGSASAADGSADRLEAVGHALPWVAPVDGGAIGGVQLSLQ